MRSRFTAHVVEDFKYLHHTWARTAQTPFVEDQPAPPIAWTGLVVHAHEPGKTPDEAFVDFSAHYVDDDGVPMALHEKSAFARVNGRWLYTRAVREGPAPIKSSTNKVGRNDPCPCGSGRKYKHCCLKTG
jgi:SEC-C motif-containing protein